MGEATEALGNAILCLNLAVLLGFRAQSGLVPKLLLRSGGEGAAGGRYQAAGRCRPLSNSETWQTLLLLLTRTTPP